MIKYPECGLTELSKSQSSIVCKQTRYLIHCIALQLTRPWFTQNVSFQNVTYCLQLSSEPISVLSPSLILYNCIIQIFS